MFTQLASTAAIGLLVASGLAASPAWADGAPGLESPSSVLTGAVAKRADVVPTDASTAVRVSAVKGGNSAVTLTTATADSSIAFTIGHVGYLGKTGNYSVLAAADKQFAAYVKAAPNGGQVIFASQSARGLGKFSIRLKDPVASQRTDSFGTIIATLRSGRQIAIATPWARDANGKSLRTSYSISGATILQHVAVSAATKYPVTADPAWTYSRSYPLGATTPAKAKSTLHSCFNCKFPVAGAPHAFPSPGQLLPLTVGPWNFNCTFGSESYSGPDGQGNTSYSFYFNAAKGHVDGLGSRITFSMTGGRAANTLSVYGYVVNDNPTGVGRPAYLVGATANWAIFASNLRT